MALLLKNKLSNQRGFASFEFVWSSIVIALVMLTFLQFFKMIHYSVRTQFDARYAIFSKIGPTVNSGRIATTQMPCFSGSIHCLPQVSGGKGWMTVRGTAEFRIKSHASRNLGDIIEVLEVHLLDHVC